MTDDEKAQACADAFRPLADAAGKLAPSEELEYEQIAAMERIVKDYGTQGAARALAHVIQTLCAEHWHDHETWIDGACDDMRRYVAPAVEPDED